ncbi:AraC-like DNA-binding protein [Parabacteroides sp. PM5-20]|uniref:helix-turn-helix transcriptional regulator n=1 Tax=Parabacteroides sp. PM5-20 TaxID=2940527 RepID=UPI0024741200|nr:AraC family transcriptional regulator [Parabacteroides sp. PM5-20]MDH6534714.1 AraC-like DNA-binding protein [Parabacteroides sp. PM5-20]
MQDQRCTKYTDCASCDFYQKQIFKYRQYPKGMSIPQERVLQNTMYFLLKGEVRVNSEEHPDTFFREGQFIMQPIGSRVEFHILEPVEAILYLFERPQNICNDRHNKGMSMASGGHIGPVVMDLCAPMHTFLSGMRAYLDSDLRCSVFLQSKQTELLFLLNCYYPIKDLAAFYSTIYRYNKSFQYFILQNYQQVKDVEAFAQLGGYSISTFRRMFKETFGEPAYQWMLKRKCQDIQTDLLTTELSISDICYKHGFESLSNFSHFCRANFGQSPRAIRAERENV